MRSRRGSRGERPRSMGRNSLAADLLVLVGCAVFAFFSWSVSPLISLVLIALSMLALAMRWLRDM